MKSVGKILGGLVAILFIQVVAIAQPSMANRSGEKWYKNDSRIARSHNVCKQLKGDVLIYAILVDTDLTEPWTEYDKETTLDSLSKVKEWIESKAEEHNPDMKLNIKIDHTRLKLGGSNVSAIPRGYSRGTSRKDYKKKGRGGKLELNERIASILEDKKGVEKIVEWGDNVVRSLTGFPNKERLISHLRNEHYVESVVLLYMFNNYYRDELLVAFNTMSNEEIEFAVTSYKYPSMIIQEVLYLFGGAALYYHPFMSTPAMKRKLSEQYPNDIMAHPTKPLGELQIGEITKYLIGWTNSIGPDQAKAFNEGKIPAKNRGDFLKKL